MVKRILLLLQIFFVKRLFFAKRVSTISKKTSSALFLLLSCICRAEDEDYWNGFDIFVEQTSHSNYNFRLSSSLINIHKKRGYYYSFDWFYFRIIEDENTGRFTAIPFMLSILSCMGNHSEPSESLFNWGFDRVTLVLTMPLMLMNPTIGLTTKIWEIGVGYNTDFIFAFSDPPTLSAFAPTLQIYFAPKIRLGLIITKNFLLSTILSYQVVDCFATKRGFHLGLSLTLLPLENGSRLVESRE